jgi:recombination protein RecT
MTQTAQAPQNGIQPAAAKQPTLVEYLRGDHFKKQIASVLPKICTPERFVRVALTAVMRSPKLKVCTQASFFDCLLRLAQLGLEPDGRRAHLIPFENRRAEVTECTLIVDYKGLNELVLRSGIVSYLHADVVYEGDLFDYNIGQITRHTPWFIRRDPDRPKDRGSRYAAYSLAKMKDGATKCEVMSAEDVLAIRDGSQGWKAFQKGYAKQSPWDPKNPQSEGEMWKKTVFRRLTKWLPLSPEILGVLELDDDPHLSGSSNAEFERSGEQLSDILRGGHDGASRTEGLAEKLKADGPAQPIEVAGKVVNASTPETSTVPTWEQLADNGIVAIIENDGIAVQNADGATLKPDGAWGDWSGWTVQPNNPEQDLLARTMAAKLIAPPAPEAPQDPQTPQTQPAASAPAPATAAAPSPPAAGPVSAPGPRRASAKR